MIKSIVFLCVLRNGVDGLQHLKQRVKVSGWIGHELNCYTFKSELIMYDGCIGSVTITFRICVNVLWRH